LRAAAAEAAAADAGAVEDVVEVVAAFREAAGALTAETIRAAVTIRAGATEEEAVIPGAA